jgi:hypothetical protein
MPGKMSVAVKILAPRGRVKKCEGGKTTTSALSTSARNRSNKDGTAIRILASIGVSPETLENRLY